MNIAQAFKHIKPAIGKGVLLTSVKIEASANRMLLTASNLVFSLSAAAEYEGEPFRCCANGKLLGEALDKLELPQIAFADERLVLSQGNTRIRLATGSADDFPTDKECADTMTVEARMAPHMERVFYAAARTDVRYYLNGIALQGRPGEISAVATDGHRLAVSSIEADVEPFEIIIPRDSAKALIALDPEQLTIGLENGKPNRLMAERGDTSLTTVLVDGQFIDWRRVLPDHVDAISVVRAELIAKLGILKPFAGESGVRMTGSTESLHMEVTGGPETATAECLLPCTGSGTLEAAFNIGYLVDALQGLTDENAVIMYGEFGKAIRMDDAGYTAIMTPMRI